MPLRWSRPSPSIWRMTGNRRAARATAGAEIGPPRGREPRRVPLSRRSADSFRLTRNRALGRDVEVLPVPGDAPIDEVHDVLRLRNPMSLARVAHEDRLDTDILESDVVL